MTFLEGFYRPIALVSSSILEGEEFVCAHALHSVCEYDNRCYQRTGNCILYPRFRTKDQLLSTSRASATGAGLLNAWCWIHECLLVLLVCKGPMQTFHNVHEHNSAHEQNHIVVCWGEEMFICETCLYTSCECCFSHNVFLLPFGLLGWHLLCKFSVWDYWNVLFACLMHVLFPGPLLSVCPPHEQSPPWLARVAAVRINGCDYECQTVSGTKVPSLWSTTDSMFWYLGHGILVHTRIHSAPTCERHYINVLRALFYWYSLEAQIMQLISA